MRWQSPYVEARSLGVTRTGRTKMKVNVMRRIEFVIMIVLFIKVRHFCFVASNKVGATIVNGRVTKRSLSSGPIMRKFPMTKKRRRVKGMKA